MPGHEVRFLWEFGITSILGVRPALFLVALLAYLPVPASPDDRGGRVTAREVVRTTVTASGEPVAYPRTDKAEVTGSVMEIPPGWHRQTMETPLMSCLLYTSDAADE